MSLIDIDKETVPLDSISLMIHIKHSICSLTVTQNFINSSSKPLFCACRLPLFLDYTISSLEVIKKNFTVMESKIQLNTDALKIFEDPLIKDYGEFLSKYDNNLVIAIGVLSPSEEITTKINIIFELNVKSGEKWAFNLPFNYLPLPKRPADMKVIIESPSEILNPDSNWNVNWTKKNKGKTLNGIAKELLTNNSTLYISYMNEALHTLTSIIQEKNGKYAVMLCLVAGDGKNQDSVEGTGEYILIIDRSGSMSGNRIQLAKQSANLILKSIPRKSKFNIISFGSQAECMFQESVLADNQAVKLAITNLLKFEADMGGTSIHNAIEAAYSTEPTKAYPRTIFLITDGGDHDTVSTLNIIRSKKVVCRVYTFGISSSDTDKQFLIDAAKFGDGSSHFINDINKLTKETMKSLKTCISACISDVATNCAGDSAPNNKNLTRYYYGEKFAQFILMNRLPTEPIKITFYDTYKKKNENFIISNIFEVKGDELFKLWAKYKINELEVTDSQEAVKVSLQYQVPSLLTSTICVTRKGSELLQIPTRPRLKKSIVSKFPTGPIPSSFDGQGNPFTIIKSAVASYKEEEENVSSKNESSKSSVKESSESESSVSDSSDSKSSDNESSESKSSDNESSESKSRDYYSSESESSDNKSSEKKSSKKTLKNAQAKNTPPKQNNEPAHQKSDFYDILNRCKIQGHWSYPDLQILCPEVIKCKKELKHIDDDIFTTVFMLAYLSLNYPKKKFELELIEKKANFWLSKFCVDLSFRSEIEKFIKALSNLN